MCQGPRDVMIEDRHTRVRVYGPEEEQEKDSFYLRQKGPAGMEPVNFTALRSAERRFKAKGTFIDFSDVLDLQNAQGHSKARKIRPIPNTTDKEWRKGDDGVPGGALRNDCELWLWEVVDGGGFCFIPGALDESQQKYWIKRSLTDYMNPPNLTNLDAHYHIPERGLWDYWQQGKNVNILRRPYPDDSEQTKSLPLEQNSSPSEIISLIRRIRWVTLGYQYDWTKKEYNFDQDPIPFPTDLANWASTVSLITGFGEFKAEAGIVNFYQPGDTLTSHVDRSEKNMNVPLLSLSLGASCIFLLGGASREDPVLPILLRSGDVIIMSGASRSFFHGVPLILSPGQLKSTGSDDETTGKALEILADARININIRQVN